MEKMNNMSEFFENVLMDSMESYEDSIDCECFTCDGSCICDCDSGNCECNVR